MNCLCLTTRRAVRHLTALYEAELSPSGVTPSQFGLLSALAAHPGLSQQQLASAADLDQTTLSRSLRLLIDSHLVRATRSKIDRRETLYAATPTGKLRQRKAKILWDHTQARMKKALGKDWTDAFALLERLSNVAKMED